MGTIPETAPALVGDSPRMRELCRLIEKAGRSRSPVLIAGETGTGKELAARAIHHVSGGGPFVPIDCAAFNKSLMESELFGHVKGAFTGAVAAKTGLLELAAGGVAFLDEIGELPLELQAKLLRVLQDRQVRPVGALHWRSVDFRIIAASNRELAAEVERGTFRRDLYYRLNVIVLRLPPLRERKEDIPALASHFLARHGGRRELAPEVMDAMLAYDWPGNVRELENCIERLAAIHSGPVVRLIDLPTGLQNFVQEARSPAAPPSGAAEPVVVPLETAEKRAILDALAFTRGDRLRAARMLGIGRTTLYRKMEKYGIRK